MTSPNILAKIRLTQSRLEALHDILQDALYLAQSAHLPACNLHDLQRSIDDTQSIFANLAAIRTRLERTHPHLQL